MTMRGSPKASNSSSWAWAPVAAGSVLLNFMALAMIDCIPSLHPWSLFVSRGSVRRFPRADRPLHPGELPLRRLACASRPTPQREPRRPDTSALLLDEPLHLLDRRAQLLELL